MINPDPNIETDLAYWELLPVATPDHELKKLVKANNTLAFIVEGIVGCFGSIKSVWLFEFFIITRMEA